MARLLGTPRFIVADHPTLQDRSWRTSTWRLRVQYTVALTAIYCNLSADCLRLVSREHNVPVQNSSVVPDCKESDKCLNNQIYDEQELTNPYWLQQVFRGHCVPGDLVYCPHSATAPQFETQPEPQ